MHNDDLTYFIQSLVPGSYVVISIGYGDGKVGQDFESTYNAQQGGGRVYNFSPEQIADLFAGLELVSPGIVPAPARRPEWAETAPVERAAVLGCCGPTDVIPDQSR